MLPIPTPSSLLPTRPLPPTHATPDQLSTIERKRIPQPFIRSPLPVLPSLSVLSPACPAPRPCGCQHLSPYVPTRQSSPHTPPPHPREGLHVEPPAAPSHGLVVYAGHAAVRHAVEAVRGGLDVGVAVQRVKGVGYVDQVLQGKGGRCGAGAAGAAGTVRGTGCRHRDVAYQSRLQRYIRS